jgi:hypothetical protein
MLLFQLVDHIFNSDVQVLFLNMNFFPMGPSIFLNNVQFFLSIVACHEIFQMSCVFGVLLQELGHWVKLRSTTWLSKFLFTKYEDDQWVENFLMSKSIFFQNVDKLKPRLLKENTKY